LARQSRATNTENADFISAGGQSPQLRRLEEVRFTSICDENAGLTEGQEMCKGVKRVNL